MPIVHRDVSPQNIVLSYDGHVKLVDFGIAKAMDSMRTEERTRTLKGKFAYMSPEQLDGAVPTTQSDVFATGVVLHEMLTGKRLFKGDNDFDTMSRVRKMVVEPPSKLNPKVPVELDQFVLTALERDLSVRYARASLLARDLDSYLQSTRFSVDAMAEFMDRSFPAAERDKVPELSAPSAPLRSQSSTAIAALVVEGSRVGEQPTRPGRPRTAEELVMLEAGTPSPQPRPAAAQPPMPPRPVVPKPSPPPPTEAEVAAPPQAAQQLSPAEAAELNAIARKVAANTATDEERLRWREMSPRVRKLPSETQPGLGPRGSERVQKKLRVGYSRVADLKITFTSDLGAGGLRVRSPQLLPDGTQLVLQLHVGESGEEPITVIGKVAWSKRSGNGFDVGVEFVELSAEQKERIEAYIQANPK
jgi:hypothetical protein